MCVCIRESFKIIRIGHALVKSQCKKWNLEILTFAIEWFTGKLHSVTLTYFLEVTILIFLFRNRDLLFGSQNVNIFISLKW